MPSPPSDCSPGPAEAEGPPVALRAAGASDWGGADTLLELPDGAGVCLVAVPRGGSVAEARSRLAEALGEEVRSPGHLRTLLMRALREVEPRPLCLGAALARPEGLWVAVTPGASVGLVRGGRVVEHTADAASYPAGPGDRLALLCCRLDPLLRDADELGRLVEADDPRASVVTLVEVGHLRGGTELSAVVAELASPSAGSVAEDELPSPAGLEDLLSSLAPTLDALRRTPTPMAHPRRTSSRAPVPVAPRAAPPVQAPEPAPEPMAADPEPDPDPIPSLPLTDTLSDDEDATEEDPTSPRGAWSEARPRSSVAPPPPARPVGRLAALLAGPILAVALVVALVAFVLAYAFTPGAP